MPVTYLTKPLTLRPLTGVSEDLLSCCDVYELFLCVLFFLLVLEVVGMPLCCQLPVSFLYFTLLGVSAGTSIGR